MMLAKNKPSLGKNHLLIQSLSLIPKEKIASRVLLAVTAARLILQSSLGETVIRGLGEGCIFYYEGINSLKMSGTSLVSRTGSSPDYFIFSIKSYE